MQIRCICEINSTTKSFEKPYNFFSVFLLTSQYLGRNLAVHPQDIVVSTKKTFLQKYGKSEQKRGWKQGILIF